jgi:hypothetical protein
VQELLRELGLANAETLGQDYIEMLRQSA